MTAVDDYLPKKLFRRANAKDVSESSQTLAGTGIGRLRNCRIQLRLLRQTAQISRLRESIARNTANLQRVASDKMAHKKVRTNQRENMYARLCEPPASKSVRKAGDPRVAPTLELWAELGSVSRALRLLLTDLVESRNRQAGHEALCSLAIAENNQFIRPSRVRTKAGRYGEYESS